MEEHVTSHGLVMPGSLGDSYYSMGDPRDYNKIVLHMPNFAGTSSKVTHSSLRSVSLASFPRISMLISQHYFYGGNRIVITVTPIGREYDLIYYRNCNRTLTL